MQAHPPGPGLPRQAPSVINWSFFTSFIIESVDPVDKGAESSVEQEPAQTPLVLIPVTAEDEARQKRRIRIRAWSAVAIVALGAAYFYKRSVDPIHARE